MLDPLTYPSKNETMESQNVVVPTEEEIAKLAEEGKFFFGDGQMDNLIATFRMKFGILARDKKSSQAENPALIREAMRPSLISQHINYQRKKIAIKKREERLAKLAKEKKEKEQGYKIHVNELDLSDDLEYPPDLDYSPVPPVDKDGNRPNSKLSDRLSALREHRRSQYRLSQ